LGKEMIDKACGDLKCNNFDKNFSIKVFMTHIEDFKMKPKERKRSGPKKINERPHSKEPSKPEPKDPKAS
jgi:hypothetical protein